MPCSRRSLNPARALPACRARCDARAPARRVTARTPRQPDWEQQRRLDQNASKQEAREQLRHPSQHVAAAPPDVPSRDLPVVGRRHDVPLGRIDGPERARLDDGRFELRKVRLLDVAQRDRKVRAAAHVAVAAVSTERAQDVAMRSTVGTRALLALRSLESVQGMGKGQI